jgi:hypothetical protein
MSSPEADFSKDSDLNAFSGKADAIALSISLLIIVHLNSLDSLHDHVAGGSCGELQCPISSCSRKNAYVSGVAGKIHFHHIKIAHRF